MSEHKIVLSPEEAREMGEHAQETAKTALSKAIHDAYDKGMTKEQIHELLDMSEVNVN